MKLAGRCDCGFAMEMVEKKPDAHMRCFGVRWCKVCGELAAAGARCKECRSRREKHRTLILSPDQRHHRRVTHSAYMRRRRRDPMFRRKTNAYAREWQTWQRKANTAAYARDKERKRLRYQNDPAWAESKRQAWRDRQAKKQAAA